MCSSWSLPRGLIDLTSDVILTSPSPHPILTLALALGGCSLVSGVHPGGGPGGSLGCIGGGPEGSFGGVTGALMDEDGSAGGSFSIVPDSLGAPGLGGIVLGGPAKLRGTVGVGTSTGIDMPSIPTLMVTPGSGAFGGGALLAGVAPVTVAPTDPRGGPLGTGRGTRLSALAFAATSVPLEGDLTGDGDLLGAMHGDVCDAVAVVAVAVSVALRVLVAGVDGFGADSFAPGVGCD